MKLKHILIVLSLLLLVGGYMGYRIYNTPHTNMAKEKSDVTATAEQVFRDYQNEEAGNAKYLGKVIELTGEILEINKKEENRHQIILDTGDMMSRISCDMDYLAEHPKLSNYKVGDKIKLKGYGTGMIMDIVLDRCIIIE